MKAAVDSNIVLDVLLDDSTYAPRSMGLLENYLMKGAVVICPVAFTECAAALSNPSGFEPIAREMGVIYDPFSPGICSLAARFWRQYRSTGSPKRRILADFLIGAHAQSVAEVLLTRDRGFYRDYFQELEVIGP